MPDTALSRKRQMLGSVSPPVHIDSGTRVRLKRLAISRADSRGGGSAIGIHARPENQGFFRLPDGQSGGKRCKAARPRRAAIDTYKEWLLKGGSQFAPSPVEISEKGFVATMA